MFSERLSKQDFILNKVRRWCCRVTCYYYVKCLQHKYISRLVLALSVRGVPPVGVQEVTVLWELRLTTTSGYES